MQEKTVFMPARYAKKQRVWLGCENSKKKPPMSGGFFGFRHVYLLWQLRHKAEFALPISKKLPVIAAVSLGSGVWTS